LSFTTATPLERAADGTPRLRIVFANGAVKAGATVARAPCSLTRRLAAFSPQRTVYFAPTRRSLLDVTPAV